MNPRLILLLKFAFALAIRAGVVVAAFLLPLVLAGFAEWSGAPGDWHLITRSLIAVLWLAMAFGLAILIFGEQNVRKAGG